MASNRNREVISLFLKHYDEFVENEDICNALTCNSFIFEDDLLDYKNRVSRLSSIFSYKLRN